MDHDYHDIHFTVIPHPEPDDAASTHIVEMRGWILHPEDERWPCETLTLEAEPFEVHVTGDPYGMVEAFRETQVFTFEERMEQQAEREARERAGMMPR